MSALKDEISRRRLPGAGAVSLRHHDDIDRVPFHGAAGNDPRQGDRQAGAPRYPRIRPGSANDTRTNGQHDPFGDDLASIGEGIAALLAEESCEPAAGQAAASASSSPSFSSFLTEALNGQPPETEKPAPQRPPEKEAPSSGTYSELQKRLITQIAEIMWFPKGTSETVREDRLIEAFDALVGIDPQDEIEGMLACQLVVTHRAMLDCMQLSMAPSTAANDRAGIIDQLERLMTVHARNLEALDQHRARNRSKPAAFGKRRSGFGKQG